MVKKKRRRVLSRVSEEKKKKSVSNVNKRKVRKVKKPSMSIRKKAGKKAKEEKFEVGFEEVIVRCPSCGREFRVVKSSGFSMEGMLCQRCAAGGGIGLEEEDV